MNNNTTYNLKAEGLLSSRSKLPTFISKFHNSRSLLGVGYFYAAFNPLTALSDYIGFKSTMGGLTKIKSMIQIPLFHHSPVHAMLSTATCDLTQLWSNAAKLIYSSVNDTFEMNVKGLIELMYQN